MTPTVWPLQVKNTANNIEKLNNTITVLKEYDIIIGRKETKQLTQSVPCLQTETVPWSLLR